MESMRNLFANLPPPAECLAILAGCQLAIFGLGGISSPIQWANGYGLPIVRASDLRGRQRPSGSDEHDAASEAEKTQIAFVAALAARNIRHAVLILALACYARDRKAVGIALLANCVSSLADTLIVRWFGNDQQVSLHAGGLLGSMAVGTVLLRWRRADPWW